MKPLDQHLFRKEVDMSVYSEILLDILAQKDKVSVMKMLELGKFYKVASHVTLHNALMWLDTHRYISIKDSYKDGRTKVCSITQKGRNYYEKI